MRNNEYIRILGSLNGNFYGGKINNLDFLIKNGFNVPKGFISTHRVKNPCF